MLSDPDIRQKEPGSPEEFYQINENLDEYFKLIADNLGLEYSNVTRLGGAACINLLIESPERKSVLKISPYDGILQVAEYFYRRASEIKLPVPKVYKLERSKSVIPFEFMLLEFMDGEHIDGIPKDKHLETGIVIGKAARQIHSIVVTEFDSYIADYTKWGFTKWQKHLSFYIQNGSREIKEKLFSPEQINIVENLLNDPRLKITEPYLLHGDLHAENCLFTLKNSEVILTAIIDPNTGFGDPMFDLAASEVLTIDNNSKDFNAGLLQGYGEISEDEQKRLDILKTIFMYWLITWREAQGMDNSLHMRKFEEYVSSL